ncbi:MAG: ABC transporter permease [Burkholderiales bacterium]|jgi:peptide/nickel transport system permease protein|nr:ABC transporter permease [Burkholderiales bacterium]
MSAAVSHYSKGFWQLTWRRLAMDRVGVVSLIIVLMFFMIILFSAFGLIASDWNHEVAINDAPPDLWGILTDKHTSVIQPSSNNTLSEISEPLPELSVVDPLAEDIAKLRTPIDFSSHIIDPLADTLRDIGYSQYVSTDPTTIEKRTSLPFGGDRWGRDVLKKTIKGTQTSLFVGLTAALLATFLGTLFGAFAGYYGSYIDDTLNWIYSVFNAIPYLLLVLAIAAVLQKRGIATVVLILGLTGWTGVFRLIRAEYMKHRAREYVMAARAFGVSSLRIMFIHILPNVSHIVLVEISILTVAFIKSEVILSFLGFGVAVDDVSWGSMLNDAQSELILGHWWELVAAGGAMALLVTAFSLFTDAIRDALDPKAQGAGA